MKRNSSILNLGNTCKNNNNDFCGQVQTSMCFTYFCTHRETMQPFPTCTMKRSRRTRSWRTLLLAECRRQCFSLTSAHRETMQPFHTCTMKRSRRTRYWRTLPAKCRRQCVSLTSAHIRKPCNHSLHAR